MSYLIRKDRGCCSSEVEGSGLCEWSSCLVEDADTTLKRPQKTKECWYRIDRWLTSRAQLPATCISALLTNITAFSWHNLQHARPNRAVSRPDSFYKLII